MSRLLPPQAYLRHLSCPRGCGELGLHDGKAHCHTCHREFAINDGMLELVHESELDEATAQELRGHIFRFTPQQVDELVRKERAWMWRSYYSCNRMKTMQHLARFLDRTDCSRVFFLGAGTGREIEYLLSFRKLQTVFCSDLSHTALHMVPARLAAYGLEVGLFTSDLQRCPVADTEIPLVVVNALHHTQDMHATLEALLGRQYENLFLVEPTDNFVIRLLSKPGWARRREYSGVLPGRLDLSRLKAVSKMHGYRLRLRTHWEFPRDYYRKFFGNSMTMQKWFFRGLNGFSILTSLVQFGNFSVVHLSRRQASPVSMHVEGRS